MTDTLLRLSDKTLLIFAMIASAILSLFAIGSILSGTDNSLAFASLERPLPSVSRMETSDAMQSIEALALFEETIAFEKESQRQAGENLPDDSSPDAVQGLPKLSAIVMQEDRITAFAFKDGIAMRFVEGDTVSGRTIVKLSLSEIVFRDDEGGEEIVVLFGTNVSPSEDAEL